VPIYFRDLFDKSVSFVSWYHYQQAAGSFRRIAVRQLEVELGIDSWHTLQN
jgi:hypothetical protein